MAKNEEDHVKEIEQLNAANQKLQIDLSNREINDIQKTLDQSKGTQQSTLLDEQLDNLRKTLDTTRHELQDTQEKFNRKIQKWKWKKIRYKKTCY